MFVRIRVGGGVLYFLRFFFLSFSSFVIVILIIDNIIITSPPSPLPLFQLHMSPLFLEILFRRLPRSVSKFTPRRFQFCRRAKLNKTLISPHASFSTCRPACLSQAINFLLVPLISRRSSRIFLFFTRLFSDGGGAAEAGRNGSV